MKIVLVLETADIRTNKFPFYPLLTILKARPSRHRFYMVFLRTQFHTSVPLCGITDVLRFVNERGSYSPAFTLLQPRYTKLFADENTLKAVIITQALNNGNLNMAEISDIPYDSLLDVYQSRVRLQTLKKANDLIGDDIAQMPIFPDYSLDMAILYGWVDGQKFEVARPTLKARRSKKYLKKVRVLWLIRCWLTIFPCKLS